MNELEEAPSDSGSEAKKEDGKEQEKQIAHSPKEESKTTEENKQKEQA